MVENYRKIIGNYFDKHSIIDSNIKSFNNFIEKGMQEIIDENDEIVPTIIPAEVKDFKIKLGKIEIHKPQIIEADGSKRDVYPIEVRLRKLTYAAPIYLNVSAIIDGVERESFTALIGKIPVMLKSKLCHLHGLNREQLIKHSEDPNDPGGYFVLNGNERVLINVEDLASNKFFMEKNKIGPSKFTAKIFSERGAYRIPHSIEQMKDGIMYISFTRFTRIPIMSVVKALGLVKDQEIMEQIGLEENDSIFISLYETVELKSQNEAVDFLAKRIGITQFNDQKNERVFDLLDKYLLPHLGIKKEDRIRKAYSLCKYIKRYLNVKEKGIQISDKDHYSNKKLKLTGDLMGELFRVNLRALVQDMMYNFQRLVKRGKFQSIKIIIRDQLLTSRIKSAMATGSWVGGRKGISQNIDRTNYVATMSHLQRVVSLLSASQENFAARALHPTHIGKLCPVETPEGTPIGLRKNLAVMAKVSEDDVQEDKIKKSLENFGLK
ncbi:DNA-directed RNA polymerase subunit B'' [archaeon]|nr:DNA-directed RNA polymerase subunit B'' [archaeon]|tara:strand:- start:14445 stop:15923 length:1479 start_codon:yes stop_codon:yes gene_type:complete